MGAAALACSIDVVCPPVHWGNWVFDALLHRADRRAAEQRYRDGLAWLTPASGAAEAEAARVAAAERAGGYLTDRRRWEIDEEVDRRLSIESAKLYGDELAELPLDAVVDGAWRHRIEQLAERWSQWLRPEHRADQHWQVAESLRTAALSAGRVDDETLEALDEFLAAIDPEGPGTIDDPWYERFARARLEAGLLPRARDDARLITQADEAIIFSEPGTVLDVVEELDRSDRVRARTDVTDVRIDASDQRVAVFAEELLFATRWEAVVGVAVGEDAHGPYVQLDDADARATHVVHAPLAALVADIARELHRRTDA